MQTLLLILGIANWFVAIANGYFLITTLGQSTLWAVEHGFVCIVSVLAGCICLRVRKAIIRRSNENESERRDAFSGKGRMDR